MSVIAFRAPSPLTGGAVVVGARKGGRPSSSLTRLGLGRILGRLGFAGDEGRCLTLAAPTPPFTRLVAIGLGKGPIDAARLRRIGAALAIELAGMAGGRVVVSLDLGGFDAAELAYGYLLRQARPLAKYRTLPVEDDPGPGPEQVMIETLSPDAALERWRRLEPVARGAFLARDLTAMPANALGPEEFAERARQLAPFGIDVEIHDPASMGLALHAAVGMGSARPPLLAVLHWNGGQGAPLALVGKGLCFDAGGISIKPAEGMEEMKGDMAGAAAVMGTLAALAGRRAPVNAVGVLALAENMPSGRALKPGDVIRSYAGLTVEAVDTDAEGRLVLADALAWTAQTFKPRAMIDAATLTGSVVRVLGHHHAGLYANDDALAARLQAAGTDEEERLWRLPLTERCDPDIESHVADLKNCSWESPVSWRLSDNDDAARFLQRFVPDGLAWAHLDIAGVAETAEDITFAAKGPTGFGVRLLDRLAESGQAG